MNKSLLTLIIKGLAIFALIAVVDFVFGEINHKLQFAVCEKFPKDTGSKTYYSIKKAHENIVIIGASNASHHYIPRIITDSTGYTVYNCGQDGHFFVFSNCIINSLLERYAPKYIIWEIGDDCLSPHYDAKYEYQSINDLYPYYDLKYCKNIIDGIGIIQRIKMLSHTYRYNSTLHRMISPFVKKQNLDNGYVPIENSGYKYPSVSKTSVESELNIVKVDMFKNTLKNCKNHNVKIIITSSPRFAINNFKGTIQYNTLLEICKKYEVPFIDYSCNDVFMQDSTLFKDINHLNDKGARKYMECFIPELKKVVDNK